MPNKQRVRFVSDIVDTSGDGHEFRVVAGPRDVARWERTGKGRSLGKLESDPSITALYEIAWTACQAQGLTTLDRREWAEQVDVDVEKSDEDGEIPPTRPTSSPSTP